jgi:hypothetical protein
MTTTRYKEMLGENLTQVSQQDRSVYSRAEVENLLLDLWNALTADEAAEEAVPVG